MGSSVRTPRDEELGPERGEELAQGLLEALEEAAVLVDLNDRLSCANRAASELLGLASEELSGRAAEEWRSLRGRLRPRERENAEGEPEEAAVQGAEPEVGLEEGPAGGPGWSRKLESTGYPRRVYQLISRPVLDAAGEPLGRLEILRNVTESARAAEERERLESRHVREMEALEIRLELAEKFKMELTANVTHDLRTPIASIKASVSGLLAGDVTYDPAVLRETLSVIEEETDRLQRRVSNLLSMAKMESGESVVHRDWVDVTDVVASALESLRSVRSDREVNAHFPEELPLVYADYDQLEIAIRNLIENAFLYSPRETPVEVHVSESLGQVRVRVRDYGAGLMPDEFERVFEKFYRGRAARRIPGTGLGLPICRAIAEAHGGHLWVEHVPEGGVAFVFSIPVSEASGLDTDEHR